MTTEYGTTYNSFIVKGSEKTALIETVHLTFFETYLKNVQQVTPLEEIDYIVLNHCEPDHTGSLAKLLELCPNAKILVSRAGSIYLKNITNNDNLPLHIVKDGEVLSLGDRTLKFINAPFLHWPDSMFTWCEEEKTLFSCDFFGCHYCEPNVFDKNITYPKKYESSLKEYFDAIFGPFIPYVVEGIKKTENLDIDYICTSHGPVLTKESRINYAFEMYREWCQIEQRTNKLIPVFYCSAYGNTGKIANSIREGILSVIPDATCEVYDLTEISPSRVVGVLNSSDAICVGSPTINADAVAPIWNLLSHVDAIGNKKKPALVFGSFGWSGEAVPNIIARLTGLKMKVFGEGFKVCFVPNEQDLHDAKELGASFAASLK